LEEKHHNDQLGRAVFAIVSATDAYEQAVRKITEVNRGNAKLVFHIGDDLAYLRTLPDGYFDWIYIDTDHSYEQTTAELAIAAVKVHPGGLIGGSDWTDIQDEDPFATFHSFPHSVARAAQEFLAEHVGYFELKYLRGGEWVMGPPAGQA
jgi:Methyltransferase domain